jgi:formyl-CoA transferase
MVLGKEGLMVPLEEIKILDLSSFVPGPYCSMLLGYLGAEVIKVEIPGKGDYLREMAGFEGVNHNKKSMTLNLKSAQGREIFYKLTRAADVILEGFRPGVTKRLGIDYDHIQGINPDIIYCSISGYGQDGPYRERPGHDTNYSGVSGLLSISGDLDGPPAALGGVPIADLSSSMFAALSILAALIARDRIGKGQYIDVSMTDGVVSWMAYRIAEYFAKDKPTKQNLVGKGAYGVFETKDGKYMTIGAIEDSFWRNLCRALGKKELVNDPRFSHIFARTRNQGELFSTILEPTFKTKTYEEWLKILLDEDVPCGPVNTVEEMFNDPQLVSRGLFEEVSDPKLRSPKCIRFPIKFSQTPAKAFTPPPQLGQHTEEVLTSLGYSQEEMGELRKQGVI